VLVGRVVKVVNPDTIDVLIDGDSEPTRVRMQGIDAPERDQVHSDKSTDVLRDLVARSTCNPQSRRATTGWSLACTWTAST
jgi:endonuclease YncB( thermonuclease family)